MIWYSSQEAPFVFDRAFETNGPSDKFRICQAFALAENYCVRYSGGESLGTLARKREYSIDAQKRWALLTTFDLSTIKSETQLITIVRDCMSVIPAQAKSDLKAWAKGTQF